MSSEFGKSAADLSGEERRFLLKVGELGVIALNPREDAVIAHLLDMGLLDVEPVDDHCARLRLAPQGQNIASRLRHNMG